MRERWIPIQRCCRFQRLTGLRNHWLDSRHATATGSAHGAPDLSLIEVTNPFHVIVYDTGCVTVRPRRFSKSRNRPLA